VRARLDKADNTEQKDWPLPKLEHVVNLDRRRDVTDAEVVALAAVNPDGDSDHAGIVAAEVAGWLVARSDTTSAPAGSPKRRVEQWVAS
jgi:hypothetical protein